MVKDTTGHTFMNARRKPCSPPVRILHMRKHFALGWPVARALVQQPTLADAPTHEPGHS